MDALDMLGTDQATQGQPHAPAQATATGDVFDQLGREQEQTEPQGTGMTRNEDGSFVITPKEGESFQDTMKRAAEAGKTVTPEMIQSQAAKGLMEAPAVLAAAPVIGAAGAASLAAPAEIPAASESYLQLSEKALEHLAENYPQLTKLAGKLGYGAGAVGAYRLLNKLGIH